MLDDWSLGSRLAAWRPSGSRARSSRKKTREVDDSEFHLAFLSGLLEIKPSGRRRRSLREIIRARNLTNSGMRHGWRLGGWWLADSGTGVGRRIAGRWLAESGLGAGRNLTELVTSCLRCGWLQVRWLGTWSWGLR